MQRLLKSGTVGAADGASDLNKGFLGDVRMKPNEICCHRLEARLLADCSGGNSRPLHPSGVGGGHFLIKKSDHRYRAALRDRTVSAALLSLTLYVEVSLVMLGDSGCW